VSEASIMIRSFWMSVTCLVALSVGMGCSSPSGAETKLTQPTPIFKTSLVILVKYKFRDDEVKLVESRVSSGTPLIPHVARPAFYISLRDANDNVLYAYAIEDPREAHVECEAPPEKCDMRKSGVMKLPEVEYVAKVPCLPGARHVKVEDPEGKLIVTTNIVRDIEEFSKKWKERPQEKTCLDEQKARQP
jgi:hypothetical protein